MREEGRRTAEVGRGVRDGVDRMLAQQAGTLGARIDRQAHALDEEATERRAAEQGLADRMGALEAQLRTCEQATRQIEQATRRREREGLDAELAAATSLDKR
eukprot:113509-Prymnesium_polylepis.1